MIGVVRIVAGLGLRNDFQWAITDLNRIGPAGHLDDRGTTKVGGEALRFDGRGSDNYFEVRAAGQQLV